MARIAIDISGGDLKQENVIVGIDLGTTNSLIARVVEGQAQCIADHGKGVIVPSLIHFAPSGQVLVGEEARSYLTQDPTRTVYSAKRLMGKSYHDVQAHTPYFSYRILDDGTDSLVKVQIGGQYYTPVELSAHILRELKARAEHRLKTEVRQVVITVPAYFNDAQRQATRDAGKLAGLDVLRILNEPTAAALAYGIGTHPEETRTVAVYDLGGGTFDVTILQINNGIFEVLATHGDTYLGGDDIDRALMLHFASQLGVALDAQTDPSLTQVLRLLAEQAKKRLSDHPTFSHTLVLPNGTQGTLQADRALLETLAAPFVARTLDCCRHALADAQLTAPQIDEVILVGGSTRMPYVQQQVAAFFGRTPLCDVNPDEVVALGAAVQADILAGNRKDLLLLDITPLSLGVETAGGLMDVIIPRNSKIPTALAKQYTTQRDGQTGMRITVFQGERELVDQNRKLAEFELKGIPAMPAGLPKVEIRFLLDADGILRVSAVELRSEVAAEIAVKPQYGLTDEEMEQMLLAGFTHAKQDVETRLQIEAREEARQLVYQAQRFLDKHAAALTEAERSQMADAVAHLQQQVDASADKQALHAAMDALDTLSRPFAQRVMEDALRTAMVGKGVGEVE